MRVLVVIQAFCPASGFDRKSPAIPTFHLAIRSLQKVSRRRQYNKKKGTRMRVPYKKTLQS